MDQRRVEWEADPKHAKVIMEEMGIEEGSQGVRSPIQKEEKVEEGDEEELNKEEASRYRRISARANYLAADRPDIQFAVKEICRGMTRPTKGHMKKLKRLARYLKEVPRMVVMLNEVDEDKMMVVEAYSDSDWAGCKGTRKSTSGGMIVMGGGLMKSWAKNQSVIALSSAEAEYYGMLKVVGEAIGFRSMAEDLGWKVRVRVWTDSSAALGIARRLGAGRVKHLQIAMLWLQERVQRGEVEARKVKGEENPADVGTKRKMIEEMEELLKRVDVWRRTTNIM